LAATHSKPPTLIRNSRAAKCFLSLWGTRWCTLPTSHIVQAAATLVLAFSPWIPIGLPAEKVECASVTLCLAVQGYSL
jgi:hypothetical protein